MMYVECCNKVMTPDDALLHVVNRDNRCQWTYELLAAMFAAQSSHPSSRDGSRISTTVLTNKCLRRIVFERQYDYVVKLEDLWALFRGTQFHGQLEPFAGPGTYAEARFHVQDLPSKMPEVMAQALSAAFGDDTDGERDAIVNWNWSFSGSPDLASVAAGIVYDYKRTKEVPRFNFTWPDHTAQLNINRWLIDYADTVEIDEREEQFVNVIDGEMYYAEAHEHPGLLLVESSKRNGYVSCTWDMTHPEVRRRFVAPEWQELTIVYVDDKGPKPITVTESIEVIGKNGRPKRARVPELWSDEQVERYIAERYIDARRAFLEGIAPIPKGWERQSHILCGYCPMRHRCAEHEAEGK